MLEKGDKNKKEKENSISKRLIYISIHKCTFQIRCLNFTVETGVANGTDGTKGHAALTHTSLYSTAHWIWGFGENILSNWQVPQIQSDQTFPSPPLDNQTCVAGVTVIGFHVTLSRLR